MGNKDSSQGNSLQIKNEDSTMEESLLAQKEVKKTNEADAMKETLPTVEKETEKGEITVQSKDSLQADDLKYEREEENLSVQQEIKETVNADAMKEMLPILENEREEGDIPVQSKDSVKADELKYENLPVQQEIKEISNADTIED